ncbi:DUF3943 domain-containing protein [Geomesophilobacter sediminis]|uniref:DUF3943 domain-containing protein n=1 Tax=Geomesophilobacter sediminis TaxID=2798584 RepID=A0A8J7LV01_9BACT|nr:DUF3943 domain-containing protein [Geomesophilobacter sediminis]MBJ6725234.1 DUF3943 domain-containing protein [Geomesophilobacter sediminis]
MIKARALFLLITVITGFSAPGAYGFASGPAAAPVPSAPCLLEPGARGEPNLLRATPPELSLTAFEQDGVIFATASPPDAVHPGETGVDKSYLIPALEVPGFLILLNVYDRVAYPNQTEDGKRVYSSTFSSTWDHLTRQNWVFDKDPFNVNQFAHPYQGATMYGLARSSGLGFWESLAYSNVGSFLWKMAGETDPPSLNDMITTGNAGSLLGEALFRMAGLVLNDDGARPDTLHEVGAAIISPPTAFNRYAFGNRFKSVFPSQHPATAWRFQVGSSFNTLSELNASFDFAMAYGLPGKPGYRYQRPLDYFNFEISGQARATNPVHDVLLRGLLYGRDYAAGEDYRGIWGLYGSYDYLSPTVFRVSTTALSLGSTGQYWVAPGIALQGTLLGGVGFGAAGSTPVSSGDRDYHYGIAPQGLLALRLLFGTRAVLDLDARAYYVDGTGRFISTGNALDDVGGSETIVRLKSGFNVRVYHRHGLGVQYVESMRDSQYGRQPSRHSRDGTVSLVYTFTGDSHFGAVGWRDEGR